MFWPRRVWLGPLRVGGRTAANGSRRKPTSTRATLPLAGAVHRKLPRRGSLSWSTWPTVLRAPGITRRRQGRGCSYRWENGGRVTRAEILDRIAKPAIPPAWRDVWSCPWPHGHLQAIVGQPSRRSSMRGSFPNRITPSQPEA
ncbi:MAG: hypothetical protein ABSC90_12400 [Acidimicrobiales bacterium]